ncbi:MAG: hypothetical protein M1582_01275, partial [Actinobacteria bacterium]|nr:hypothetical protein [Actinomycetota bacterium]
MSGPGEEAPLDEWNVGEGGLYGPGEQAPADELQITIPGYDFGPFANWDWENEGPNGGVGLDQEDMGLTGPSVEEFTHPGTQQDLDAWVRERMQEYDREHGLKPGDYGTSAGGLGDLGLNLDPGQEQTSGSDWFTQGWAKLFGGFGEGLGTAWANMTGGTKEQQPAVAEAPAEPTGRQYGPPIPVGLPTGGPEDRFRLLSPEQIGMVVDDTGYTALFGMGKSSESMAAFRGNVASAAYHVRHGARALIIGPGGGKDILCALSSGARSVTAVEVNPLVVRAADEVFGEFTGRPYRMPGVRAVVEEGRNFLAADRTRYDVLQMTQVFGRIPPSAVAFTMSEDHLHTVEAFRGYLSHLSDDGILTITRFLHERRERGASPVAAAGYVFL